MCCLSIVDLYSQVWLYSFSHNELLAGQTVVLEIILKIMCHVQDSNQLSLLAGSLDRDLTLTLLKSLNGRVHFSFLEMFIINIINIKIRIWSDDNSIEPGQSAWMCRLAWLYTGGKGWPYHFSSTIGKIKRKEKIKCRYTTVCFYLFLFQK